jgi:hypothetical protein
VRQLVGEKGEKVQRKNRRETYRKYGKNERLCDLFSISLLKSILAFASV